MIDFVGCIIFRPWVLEESGSFAIQGSEGADNPLKIALNIFTKNFRLMNVESLFNVLNNVNDILIPTVRLGIKCYLSLGIPPRLITWNIYKRLEQIPNCQKYFGDFNTY